MLLNLRDDTAPLYRRIYDALKAQIGDGRLRPGEKLPSSRALAGDLGVSRNTVMLAYEQLVAEGYIVSRDRSGITVVDGMPIARRAAHAQPGSPSKPKLSSFARRAVKLGLPLSASQPGKTAIRYDFRYARPVVDEFALKIWPRLVSAHARNDTAANRGYATPAGYAPLRQALAEYLRRARGVTCDADQIVIVNGSQQALDLVSRVLLDPGDPVVMEEPHYPGARAVFEAAGARIIEVPVDAAGLDTGKLARITRARLACVAPCHQFPTGTIMPLGRRMALLEWASRNDAWIVEDDYVSEFRYEGRPLEVLQALDGAGRVVYIGSFSKTLFPALRLGYLVLPRALVEPFLAAKWITDRYSATLGQEALAEFIASGHFERYLRRASARNAAKRRTLIAALNQHLAGRVDVAGENAGVHLVVWLNGMPPRELDAVIARAAEAGVGIYPVTPFYARSPKRAGLLLGYASLTAAEIRAGIARLCAVLAPQ